MSIFQEPLSEIIWDTKYRYRQQEKIIDHTLQDTWHRIAKAIAKGEKTSERKKWTQEFYSILENFHFLPGGRILAGAGTKHKVTLFNCFVMPVQDSLISLFDALKEGALTLQQGGGIGYDFSPLRPQGYPAIHTGSVASGPVSFMKIWNAMCATMQSTGSRRGAMMGILRCDHPDIETFISAKSDPHELRHFNVSVLITDKFMHAVKNNLPWNLTFSSHPLKKINARTLWQTIMTSAYHYAEPGVVFEDTINQQNNLWYSEKLTATNPCGEIPLPSYGACNLGAINLTQCVLNPFTEKATLHWEKLIKITEIATRFLDNVIDVSRYPLKAQKQQAHITRRIGLGITGLADMFVMMNISYGSQEALQLAEKIIRIISHTTWKTSVELARERGSFPTFEKENYLKGNFVQQLPNDIQQAISKNGIRNSHHNTIAPTGTISLLANNISNGIEPIFSGHAERHVRFAHNELKTFSVMDYALRSWRQQHSEKFPPAWIDAHTLSPSQHLQMQAVLQPYIDNAISKTINIPEHFPLEKLADVYVQAHSLGLKGCTIFRPNPVTGSVLTPLSPEEESDRCCQLS